MSNMKLESIRGRSGIGIVSRRNNNANGEAGIVIA